MRTKKNQQLVKQAILRALQRLGDSILDKSQQTVPVDRGTLMRSGYTKKLAGRGVEVGYTAPYAAQQEFGMPSLPYEGVQRVKIKPYNYRLVDNEGNVRQVEVPAHERTYVNKRLIGFRPRIGNTRGSEVIFRVMDKSPEIQPKYFLSNAVKDSLPELPQLIIHEMKKIPNVKVK